MNEPTDTNEMTVLPVADPDAELPAPGAAPGRISLAVRLAVLVAIIVPLLGVVAAPFFVWGWGFRWTDLGLLLGMYVLTALGITVGFHRLFVHRSFETNIVVKFVLAVLGSMAVQGPLLKWVAMHRRHHQHSDTAGDPHSPHLHGRRRPRRAARHLARPHRLAVRSRPAGPRPLRQGPAPESCPPGGECPVPRCGSPSACLIPAVLGGLLTRTWAGVWTGLIWGGLVRIFLVHHVTWSVNSACHLWGLRPYRSDDESRNNVVFGVLAMGEGWHNTHHAFPTSARHGLRWWQIDVSYWVIWTLARVGLAWDVKLPTMQAQRQRRGVT